MVNSVENKNENNGNNGNTNNNFNTFYEDDDDEFGTKNEKNDFFEEFNSEGVLSGEERMVEKDVFGYISRISGMALTVSDLTILADCTDCHPLGERIKVDVILECITINNEENGRERGSGGGSGRERGRGRGRGRGNNEDDDDYDDNDDNNFNSSNNLQNSLDLEVLSEPALFALKHISHQIWRTGDNLNR